MKLFGNNTKKIFYNGMYLGYSFPVALVRWMALFFGSIAMTQKTELTNSSVK